MFIVVACNGSISATCLHSINRCTIRLHCHWWRGWLSRGCCLSFRIPTLGLRRCSIYGVPVRHNTWTPPQYHYFTRYTSPRRSLFADVSTCAAAAAAALFFTAAVHRAQFGGVLRQKVVRVGDRRKNAERLLMMMVVVVMRKRK